MPSEHASPTDQLAEDPRVVWSGTAWRSEVADWVAASLAAAGLRQTGPLEQHRMRMWSVQLTVPTDHGLVWFKENHPGQRAEAAVVGVLARLSPEHVVEPIAVEPERGWLLSPDGGPTLSSVEGVEGVDLELWRRLVVQFAQLQRQLADHGQELASAGLESLAPADTADVVEQVTDAMRRKPASSATSLTPDEHERVRAALPRIAAMGARLESLPGGVSLQHNDLHANNVFAPRLGEHALRFFDFGDAVWAHPFSVLGVPVRVLCGGLETGPDDQRVRAVVDAYLEEWSDLAPRSDLLEAAELGLRLSCIHRFESWRRLLDGGSRAVHPEDAENLRYWVGQVADLAG